MAANSEPNNDQFSDDSGIDNRESKSKGFFFEAWWGNGLWVLELVWFRDRVEEDVLSMLDAYVEVGGVCAPLESRVDKDAELDKRRLDDSVEAYRRTELDVVGRLEDADEGRVDVASDVID